ncbi:DUF2085 domain-containing protein [Bacillus sp. cl95]|uniref:DUF2085 domain-containing protein n=2 Tax=unclassified Bacillus (in: firmicutes) TaxID=185979 RepID=UPI0008F147DF|nr:Uncharacterized membrane protein [Bacillus sp. cl95]
MGNRTVTVHQTVINRIFGIVPCHRMKSRSIAINGYTFPICARCTGILAGYLAFPFLLLFNFECSFWLGVLMNIPMVLDGWTQQRKYRSSNNFLRLATGLTSGVGQSIIIVSVSQYILSFF